MQEAKRRNRWLGDRRSPTRRGFLRTAAGLGAALAVEPAVHAITCDDDAWEPVSPDEHYDPGFEYVQMDCSPLEWEWVEPDEECDPEFDYLYVDDVPAGCDWVHDEWEAVEADELFDPGLFYADAELIPIQWDFVATDEMPDPEFHYLNLDRTHLGDEYWTSWVPVEEEEEFNANCDYVFGDGSPVGEDFWIKFVNFDDPEALSLDGEFGGIFWGHGWSILPRPLWSGACLGNLAFMSCAPEGCHVYKCRAFAFVDPSILTSVDASSHTETGILSLRSFDAGGNLVEVFQDVVTPDKCRTIETGWTQPAHRVDVCFEFGSQLAISTVRYGTAPDIP